MQKFKNGVKVKVVANGSGHHIPMGFFLTVKGYNGMYVLVKENTLNFLETDLEIYELTYEDLEKKYREKEQEFLKVSMQMDYMKTTKANKLVDAEYKAFVVKNILTSKDSEEEKVKKIRTVYEEAA